MNDFFLTWIVTVRRFCFGTYNNNIAKDNWNLNETTFTHQCVKYTYEGVR